MTSTMTTTITTTARTTTTTTTTTTASAVAAAAAVSRNLVSQARRVSFNRLIMPAMASSATTLSTATSSSEAVRMLKRKFPCMNCSSIFSRKGGLTYHLKFECGQTPRFKCPYCTYCARHISNARRHVKKCHVGWDVYTVDLCQLQQQQ